VDKQKTLWEPCKNLYYFQCSGVFA